MALGRVDRARSRIRTALFDLLVFGWWYAGWSQTRDGDRVRVPGGRVAAGTDLGPPPGGGND